MEERLQKMEKFQEQVTQDMKNLRDDLEKSQENLMSKLEDKLTQLLSKATNSGKGRVQEIPEEDSSSLPRKPQETGPALYSLLLEKLKEEQSKDFGATDDKFKHLEERIKAMEGTDAFIGTDAMELSLVPDLILPPNFKVPEFEKFDGTSCPNAHLTMFCRKMTGYGNDDKLLIHCFQDSLTGSAMRWYNQLSRVQVSTWRELARAFKEQYKHVLDMVPDRLTLQNIGKKDKESFREYAQRWRDIAAQVQPPLLEKETTTLFINSLESTPMYYARLVGSTTRDFADLVTAGEAIERAIKSERLISPIFLTPLQPPYPAWYDPSAHCEYHAGIPGHSIENCMAFKRRVQHLINQNVIQLNISQGPNVANNPLPAHDEPRVNAVTSDNGTKIKTNISEVLSPLKWVWEMMIERGLDLMDNKEVEFFEKSHEIKDVFVLEEQSSKMSYGVGRPFLINVPRKKEGGPEKPPPRLVIEAPSPFSYKNSHQVPWIYGCNMTAPKREVSEIEIAGISGVGNFTRSGRCHPLDISKSMENKDAEQKDKFPLDGGIPEINEPVREEDAHEFLKFIKHSEYSVVEQLHKQPARISVLTLLLSSEPHRNALLKVLNQTFVPNDVSVDKLDRLVNNLHVDNFISFSEDEIPAEGTGSVKALHITTHCHGHILPHVLVDNGSALNVMPMSTLNRLPVDKAHIRPCHTSVRAFDGTRREVVGKIDVPLLIGPATYNVETTLDPCCRSGTFYAHQKVKFVIDGRLISVGAEEDIIASTSTDAPYIDVDENAIECTFRSLEFVNATFVGERKKIPKPRLSKNTLMGVRLTVGKGARSGKGLGKSLQGMHTSLQPILKYDRSGVGYKPNPRQRMKKILRMREQRRARLIGQSIEEEPMQFPRISETFVSGGHIHSEGGKKETLVMPLEMIHELSINAVGEDDEIAKNRSEIRPCPPGCVLNNWTYVELPIVFKTLNE
ncbi:hypothetical protein GQ457_17G013990 [Hibiscus cannabinus]